MASRKDISRSWATDGVDTTSVTEFIFILVASPTACRQLAANDRSVGLLNTH